MPRLPASERQAGSNHQRSSQYAQVLPNIRARDLPPEFISIDPGAVHCGVARWLFDKGECDRYGHPLAPRLELVEAYERTPDGLAIELRSMKEDGVGLVICEDFLLQKGRNQAGSRMPTVKTIGVVEYECRLNGLLCRLQNAGIKDSVNAWYRAKTGFDLDGLRGDNAGWVYWPVASNSHKRDAVRHGVYPVLRDKNDRERVTLVIPTQTRRGQAATV